jgi:hypothetical protein
LLYERIVDLCVVMAVATQHRPQALMNLDVKLFERVLLAIDGEVASLVEWLYAICNGLVVEVL